MTGVETKREGGIDCRDSTGCGELLGSVIDHLTGHCGILEGFFGKSTGP